MAVLTRQKPCRRGLRLRIFNSANADRPYTDILVNGGRLVQAESAVMSIWAHLPTSYFLNFPALLQTARLLLRLLRRCPDLSLSVAEDRLCMRHFFSESVQLIVLSDLLTICLILSEHSIFAEEK